MRQTNVRRSSSLYSLNTPPRGGAKQIVKLLIMFSLCVYLFSKEVWNFITFSLHCCDSWFDDRKDVRRLKNWVLVCWLRHFDWSFERLIAPVFVTTTSITLSCNKIQNGDIPVLANPGQHGKWPLKRTESRNLPTDRRISALICQITLIMYTAIPWLLFCQPWSP